MSAALSEAEKSSKYEGIPNTLIEAMSMGLPCVATNCSPGGAEFLLESGKYGALIDIDDVDAMAQEILKYIENPEYAIEMGEKAKASISRFQPEIIRQYWSDFFGKIVETI